MQPPIGSRTVATNNILLRVTVKRRRKRRRDVEGNVIREPEERKNESLIDKIQASKGDYSIEALGRVDKTIRFRGMLLTIAQWLVVLMDVEMADFEWNTHTNPFVDKLKDTLLTAKCKTE